MEFDKHKDLLNKELEQFNSILSELLPRYLELVRKVELDEQETKELGEIEHYLIEVNGKIAEIKNKLDNDLFGETIDIYYKTKQLAAKGDPVAKEMLTKLRKKFSESVQGDTFFNWN